MIEVRPGTPEDAEAIADINVRSWQASFRGHFPDDFLDSLDPRDREPWVREVLTSGPPHHVAVAVDDDQVVGFVILGPPFDAEIDPNKTIELYSLYIEPDRIGTGLGRTLMNHALAQLARRAVDISDPVGTSGGRENLSVLRVSRLGEGWHQGRRDPAGQSCTTGEVPDRPEVALDPGTAKSDHSASVRERHQRGQPITTGMI